MHTFSTIAMPDRKKKTLMYYLVYSYRIKGISFPTRNEEKKQRQNSSRTLKYFPLSEFLWNSFRLDGWSCMNCASEHLPRGAGWIFALAQRALLVFLWVCATFGRSGGGGDEAPNYPGWTPLAKEGACAGHTTREPRASDKNSAFIGNVCVLHREGNFSPSSMSVIDMLMKNSGVSF